MTNWPDAASIRAAIAWNEEEHRRASRDAREAWNGGPVPGHAVKWVRGEKVPMTREDYAKSRENDMARFAGNIVALKSRL